jgi:hypothetical protein
MITSPPLIEVSSYMADKIILNEFSHMMHAMIRYVIRYFFLMVNLVGIEILQGEEHPSMIMKLKMLKMAQVYGFSGNVFFGICFVNNL